MCVWLLIGIDNGQRIGFTKQKNKKNNISVCILNIDDDDDAKSYKHNKVVITKWWWFGNIKKKKSQTCTYTHRER